MFTGRVCDPERFDGEICGFGTTSGVRVVIGRWERSPFGSFADAMVETSEGHRVLLAPAEVAEYVARIYDFDEIEVGPLHAQRRPDALVVRGGPLATEVSIGRRTWLGWTLRAIPARVVSSHIWPVLTDPVARIVMPGVRTRGTTPGGRETYAASDLRVVDEVCATWHGADLGPLAPLDPPVRFGFSSAPRRPCVVAVTTAVYRHADDT
jgi:hypothetical protein